MAVIRKKEIKNMSKKESEEKIKDLELEILKIKSKRSQAASGSKKIKDIKKTIARLYTQIKEK